MTSLQTGGVSALANVMALVEGPSRAAGRNSAAGSPRAYDGWLNPDVRTWLASPEQGVRAAIESVSGVEATVRALAGLASSRLTLVANVPSDRACWAEVVRHGEAGPETCIVGLTYDAAGRVCRLVWLRAPLVASREAGAGGAAPDGRPVIESYFAALMNSQFREAAAHFTVDTLYSHPPYARGNRRILFRGRDALADGFETDRGPSPARQIITDLWQRGSRAFVEGVIEGIPDGGTFFSTAEISAEGEIARYVAFYSSTRIPSTR